MISLLNDGHILDVYFIFTSYNGHAVNIYNYYYDNENPDIVYFEVYDSNIPQNYREGINLKYKDKCILKVWKKKKLIGKGYTFGYDYSPIKGNDKYRATTNLTLFKRYGIIVFDENWNTLYDK